MTYYNQVRNGKTYQGAQTTTTPKTLKSAETKSAMTTSLGNPKMSGDKFGDDDDVVFQGNGINSYLSTGPQHPKQDVQTKRSQELKTLLVPVDYTPNFLVVFPQPAVVATGKHPTLAAISVPTSC